MSYLLSGADGVSDVRNFTGVTSLTTITDADIIEYIDLSEAEIFSRLGVRYYSDYVIEKYDGTGTDILYLQHFPLLGVCYLIIDGATIASDDYYVYTDTNQIKLASFEEFSDVSILGLKSAYQNIEVGYCYGVTSISDPFQFKIVKKLALYTASIDVLTRMNNSDTSDSNNTIVQEKLGDYTLSYNRTNKYDKKISYLNERVNELYDAIGVNIVARIF